VAEPAGTLGTRVEGGGATGARLEEGATGARLEDGGTTGATCDDDGGDDGTVGLADVAGGATGA
jgi:hypothetical protein